MRASCSSPMGPKNDAGAPLSRARNHRRHDQQAFAAARGLTQTELRHHASDGRRAMKYRKHEAKDYSRVHMRGIFAAANTPFRPGDLALDEAGLRANMRHWINDLAIDGLFVAGKQGEFFSLTLAERKRLFDIAVEETAGKAQTVLSCSDQNLDVVIELARHAEAIGGDYIIVHAPMLHFHHAHDDCVREYYRYIASQVSIGIALWSHPDSGYLLEPRAVRRARRHRERGRDQVQRAARDVRKIDAARRRQVFGVDRLRGGVVRQHRRARVAALSVLDRRPTRCKPRSTGGCANTPTSPWPAT